jgi:hypothetical protein
MRAAELAYPGLRWAEVPLAVAPLSEEELRELADAIDEVVAAWQTLELDAEGGATLRLDAQFGENVAATAASRLEVVFSPLGRFATLREVRQDERSDGLEESAVLGVDDRRWAGAVKALQGLLRARAVTLLDMAFLAERVPVHEQPAYEALYGATLTWWSLLFRAMPPEACGYRRGPSV